ncbi:30S ribosomal protein S8 [Patescibacteria group bacterium]|nr:30S ribosomal protein S8 [Patescibacteria group bacterium]
MTDPISDMLARIRNAALVNKSRVLVPYSNLKAGLAQILLDEGYIEAIGEETSPKRSLVISLKYLKGKPAIQNLKRISKPGRRHYVKSDSLPKVLSGLGIAIVSTSQGLMTNKKARAAKLGGEVICEIY